MDEKNSNNSIVIAGAIMLHAIIIAGAIIYSSGTAGFLGNATSGGTAAVVDVTGDEGSRALTPEGVKNIKPVTKDSHIRGDINAPIKIVEFSDTECPFCKRFHETMTRVVNEYQGKVAWVYRHFPLDSIHSKARKEAEATECANELGGNDKFWAYLDKIFAITPSNNGLDLSELPKIAEQVGLNRKKFEQCLNGGKYASHIQGDLDDAISSGGTGTPYSVLIAANGKKFVISGAQPYEAIKQVIESALSEK